MAPGQPACTPSSTPCTLVCALRAGLSHLATHLATSSRVGEEEEQQEAEHWCMLHSIHLRLPLSTLSRKKEVAATTLLSAASMPFNRKLFSL